MRERDRLDVVRSNRVQGLVTLTSQELSLAVARRALVDSSGAREVGPPSLDAIADAVGGEFGLSTSALRARRRRDRQASLARQVAVRIARRLSGRPLSEIAADLGFRDHSGAAHAWATLSARLGSDRELASRVAQLERRLAPRRRAALGG